MRWIDLPPLAEVEDRLGRVRRLYGPSLLGRFAFADRLNQISETITTLPNESQWVDEYGRSPKLRAAIDGAMELWGLDSDWFSPLQIQALLLYQEPEEDGKPRPGALLELLQRDEKGGEQASLPQALAMLSTHCQSLVEALDLAQNLPADLLVDVLKSKSEIEAEINQNQPRESAEVLKSKEFVRQNFDKLMAAASEG